MQTKVAPQEVPVQDSSGFQLDWNFIYKVQIYYEIPIFWILKC